MISLVTASNGSSSEETLTLVMPLHLTGTKFVEFESALSTNTVLQSIDLKGNEINDEMCMTLCRGLRNSSSLTSLNLSKNRVTVNSVAAINKLVSQLVTLNLSYNNIGDSGAQKLSTALADTSVLENLSLDTAAIKHYGASFLASAIAVNRSLVLVNLSGNLVSTASKRIAFAMMRNAKLQNVLVGDAHLESIGAEHFSRFMESSMSLTNIDLFGNGITDDGCLAIANALTINRSIRRICLSRNLIRDEGFAAISSSLVANDVLEILEASGNFISDIGMKKIGTVLIISGALKELDVSDCRLTSESALIMSDVLKNNDSLVILNMSENEIKADCLRQLHLAIEVNDSLEAIYLGAEALGTDGVDELTQLDQFWDTRICVV